MDPIGLSECHNDIMLERVEKTPVQYPFIFLIAGTNHIAPNRASDAVFGQMVGQMEQLRPRPLFFANLGDLPGPVAMQEHENYFGLVECLSIPNLCSLGAHDRDRPTGEPNRWTAGRGSRLYGSLPARR